MIMREGSPHSDFQLELMGEKCEVQEATKFCQCRISETRRPCAKLIKESIQAHSQSCSQEVFVCRVLVAYLSSAEFSVPLLSTQGIFLATL